MVSALLFFSGQKANWKESYIIFFTKKILTSLFVENMVTAGSNLYPKTSNIFAVTDRLVFMNNFFK